MSNETTPEAPLTATVGERLEDKAHEGDRSGAERVAEAGGPRAAGTEPRPLDAERAPSGARAPGRRRPPGGSRRSARAWGIGAGLGAYVVARLVGRLFRR